MNVIKPCYRRSDILLLLRHMIALVTQWPRSSIQPLEEAKVEERLEGVVREGRRTLSRIRIE